MILKVQLINLYLPQYVSLSKHRNLLYEILFLFLRLWKHRNIFGHNITDFTRGYLKFHSFFLENIAVNRGKKVVVLKGKKVENWVAAVQIV